MKREVQMMKELQHPNLPLFIAELEESGDGYIVMERVTGNELTHIIRSAAQSHQAVTPTGSYVPWKVIIAFGRQLLSVLDHMHGKGYIHRDIKPANVHLGDDGELRVLDLGVAKSGMESEQQDLSPQAGTPSFLAPEQFDGQPASPQTDLYATGVTLYYALTRHYPYGEVEPFQRPRFGEPVPPWLLTGTSSSSHTAHSGS